MTDLIKPFPGESEDSFAKRKAYYIRNIRHRFAYSEKVIKTYLPNGIPLTQSEKEEIDEFWSHYLAPEFRDRFVDYRYYTIFKKIKKDGQRLAYYLPDSFYSPFVDDYFTNPQQSVPVDDKNLYDLYFHDVNQPKTVFRKVDGMYMDSNYKVISLEDALKKSKDEGEVVLKVCRFSCGGHGVLFWNADVDDDSKMMSFLQGSNNIICQKAVKQHPDVAVLNPSSINTMRMTTLFFNNEVHHLSSFIRFGGPGSKLDNIHSGGYGCGVESDGHLRDTAFDIAANQTKLQIQGKSLNQIKVPNFDKCVELVKELAHRFATVSRLIGWDISIDENGEPMLIEFGTTFGGCNFPQLCHGPVFGDLTEDVLKEVVTNSFTLNSIIKSFQ